MGLTAQRWSSWYVLSSNVTTCISHWDRSITLSFMCTIISLLVFPFLYFIKGCLKRPWYIEYIKKTFYSFKGHFLWLLHVFCLFKFKFKFMVKYNYDKCYSVWTLCLTYKMTHWGHTQVFCTAWLSYHFNDCHFCYVQTFIEFFVEYFNHLV